MSVHSRSYFVRSSILYARLVLIRDHIDQTPPRRELRASDLKLKSQSLLSLQLAPSSMLYIKFEQDESLNGMSTPVYIMLIHDVD